MAARRDIKALTAGIAGLTEGDRVRAGISHPQRIGWADHE